MTGTLRQVSSDEIRSQVSMPTAIAAVRDVLRETEDGLIDQPMRWSLADGDVLVMAASHRRSRDMVLKVLSMSGPPGDTSRPTITGTALWWDGTSGEVSLLADAVEVTSLRTGALVGVATDCLAPRDASRLALLGAGQQALDQVRAVAAVRPVRELTIYNRTRGKAERLQLRLAAELPGLRTEIADTAAAAVEGADIVCCATAATLPLFDPAALAPHAHVNAIGSYRADMRELHEDVLAGAAVLAVDNADACVSEAGEIIAAIKAGKIPAARLTELSQLLDLPERPDGLTVFKSVGTAVLDWAVTRALVRSFFNATETFSAESPGQVTPISVREL